MRSICAAAVCAVHVSATAATFHVSPSGSHTAPFADWATASTNLEAAVALAGSGDEVLLDDGTYLPETVVSVNAAITIRSANGASACILDGTTAGSLLSVSSGGVVLEGLTLVGCSGAGLSCSTPGLTVRGCNIDIAGGVTAYGAAFEACAISNVQPFTTSDSTFSNCTFGLDTMFPPPFQSVSFVSSSQNRFGNCAFKGRIRLELTPGPPRIWVCDTCTVAGTLEIQNAVVQGSLSGDGTIWVQNSTLDGCTVPHMGRISGDQATFTNCTFGLPGPPGPMEDVTFDGLVEGSANAFLDCAFAGRTALASHGFVPTPWTLTGCDIAGTLSADRATLYGSFGGDGSLAVQNSTLDACTVPHLSWLSCQASVLTNCVLGDTGSLMIPDVAIRAMEDGATNDFVACTFKGRVSVGTHSPVQSTWLLGDCEALGEFRIELCTARGTLSGPGTLSLANATLEYSTISNLAWFLSSASQIHDCDIQRSPGRGVQLSDGSVLSHSRIHHNGGGGIQCVGSTIRNCEIWGNESGAAGGGVDLGEGGWITACTIVGNTAPAAGGVRISGNAAIDNSIVQLNTGGGSDNWRLDAASATWEHTCTTPLPAGPGNLASAPQFAPGSLRLSAGSPCRDAGLAKPWMTGAPDLDGHPRIVNAVPDLGAYEFIHAPDDFDGDGLSNGAETGTHGTDPNNADSDGDRQPDNEELIAGTNPNQTSSVFAWKGTAPAGPTGIELAWPSVTGRFYTVTRADDLSSGFGATIASNLPATPPLNTLTDTNTAAGAAHFYRIIVTQP